LLDCPWRHTDLGHRLRRPSRHGLVLARYLRTVTGRRLLLCRNVLGLSYRGWPVQLGRHPCPASLRSRRRLGDGLVHVYWDRRNGSSQQLRQSPFLFSHTTPPFPQLLFHTDRHSDFSLSCRSDPISSSVWPTSTTQTTKSSAGNASSSHT
jgi:hypothetical protein